MYLTRNTYSLEKETQTYKPRNVILTDVGISYIQKRRFPNELKMTLRKVFFQPLLAILMLICISISVSAQKNYALFTLDDIQAACLTFDGRHMLGIEAAEDKSKLNLYRLETGELKMAFDIELPAESIKQIISHPSEDLMYLITARLVDNRKYMLDAIYSFNPMNSKLKKLYTEKKELKCPTQVKIVNNNLVLTSGFDPSNVFNLENNNLHPLTTNEDLRLFSTVPEQNGYILVNIKEGDEDVKPLYFLNQDGGLSEEIAKYDSRMVMSTVKSENKVPHLIIDNEENTWVEEAYQNNCMPISMFEIASHKNWSEVHSSLDQSTQIATLLAANSTYLLAASRSKIFVYNYAEPQTVNPAALNENELDEIKAYFGAKTSYEKKAINSSAIQQIFDAKFYRIDITTQIDESSYTSDKFFAINYQDSYTVLRDCSELTAPLKQDYTMSTKESAMLFEEVLDKLYPVGTFDEKHKTTYQIGNNWIFVRSESFGDYQGYVVETNADGTVQNIKYESKLETN